MVSGASNVKLHLSWANQSELSIRSKGKKTSPCWTCWKTLCTWTLEWGRSISTRPWMKKECVGNGAVPIWMCKWGDIVNYGHSKHASYFFSHVTICCLLPCFWLGMMSWHNIIPFFLEHHNACKGGVVNHSGQIFIEILFWNLRQLWRKYADIVTWFQYLRLLLF